MAVDTDSQSVTDVEDLGAESPAKALAIGFALGGALVLLGGALIRLAHSKPSAGGAAETSFAGVEYWVAFMVCGLLMAALGYPVLQGWRWAHSVGPALMAAVVMLFGSVVSATETSTTYIPAYGLIAAGIVAGVAALSSGRLRPSGK